MKYRSKPFALILLITLALSSLASADGPSVQLRLKLSSIKANRDHGQNHHRGERYRETDRQAAKCGCRCGSGDSIRLVAGSQRGKPNRPKGWHKREWFECRGYNLDNYAHKHRDGTVHYGRNVKRGKR